MKKLFSIACALAAGVAFATDTEIQCGEVVGQLEISSTSADTIVAVPFGELSTGGNICASNIVKTANLTAGDELYVYAQGDKSWTAWVLTQGSGYLYWKSVGTATIALDGTVSHGTTPEASTVTLPAGDAIWLKRKGSSLGSFYVYGSYKSVPTTTVEANKLTLVANPKAGDPVVLTDKFEKSNKDSIIETDGKRSNYNSNSMKWVHTKVVEGVYTTETKDNFSLEQGQGVWLKCKKGATINW